MPAGTDLTVSVRSGNDANALGGFTVIDNGDDVGRVIDPTARYFQYRLVLSSADVAASPVVSEVGFHVEPGDNPSSPPAGNEAPVANAGQNYTYFPRQTATLDGSRSFDADGQIVSYQWKQVSGKSVRLRNADQAIATFTTPRVRRNQIATLVFELSVTDDAGASSSDTVEITVRR